MRKERASSTRLLMTTIKFVSSAKCFSALISNTPYSSISTKQPFFEVIGSPKYVAAPMVEQSDKAFRLLCRKHGCDLTFSQMIHARHFAQPQAAKFRFQYFDGDQTPENGTDSSSARPLIAQFCGNDPKVLVDAAKYIDQEVDACDLNLGCPQQIAKRGNYGAYLLQNSDLCAELVGAMACKLACPVTAKIRCLENREDTITLALKLEAAGAQMITVHGRTLNAAKTNNGAADWSIIKEIKNTLKIPVIANGGIETFADVQNCLEQTGADGVMSSEALLEDPALFDLSIPSMATLKGKKLAQRQLSLTKEYLELTELYPPRVGISPIRAHIFKILYQVLNTQPDLRAKMGRCGLEGIYMVVKELGVRFGWDYEEGAPLEFFPNETCDFEGGSWYRRHRNEY